MTRIAIVLAACVLGAVAAPRATGTPAQAPDDAALAEAIRTALTGRRIFGTTGQAADWRVPAVEADGPHCPRDAKPLRTVILRAPDEAGAWRMAGLVCETERVFWTVAWRQGPDGAERVVHGPFALRHEGAVPRVTVDFALEALLGPGGESWGYYQGMFGHVAALGRGAIPHLIEIARTARDGAQIGVLAIEALGDCATADDLPAVQALADDPGTETRRESLAIALAKLGDRRLLERQVANFERRLVEVRGVDPNAGELVTLFERLADATLRGGAPARAVECYRELVVRDLPKHRGVHFYNMACAHVRLGDPDAAMAALEQAVAAGLDGAEWIRHDTDLRPLWRDPRFEAFMQRVRARGR